MQITNKRTFTGAANVTNSDNRNYDILTTIGPLTVPNGKGGTVTTHTSNSAGVITLGTGHGFLVNDVFDLYWSTGQLRHLLVTGVTSTTVTFDSSRGGNGDNLPAVSTAIVAAKLVRLGSLILAGFVSFQFTGVTAKCTIQEMVLPEDSNSFVKVDGGELAVYDNNWPLSGLYGGDYGDENALYVSNGSATADALFRLIAGYSL